MGVIGSSIMFQIGSVGGKDAAKNIGLVVAALGAASVALGKIYKSSEEYARSYRRMTDAQKDFFRALDGGGKGLVDTGIAAKETHKAFEMLGQKATPELADAIARLTVNVGQKAGESYDQIQARVSALVKAIGKGAGRAFGDYGVKIYETTNLLDAQNESIAKIIARAKGLEVKVNDLGYSWDAFKNALGTAIDSSIEMHTRSGELGGALNSVTESLNEGVSVMQEYDGKMHYLAQTGLYWSESLRMNFYDLVGLEKQAQAVRKSIQLMTVSLQVSALAAKDNRAYFLGGQQIYKPGTGPEGSTTPTSALPYQDPIADWIALGQKPPPAKKKGGGGGRGRAGLAEYLNELNAARLMEQQIAELRSPIMMGEGLAESQFGRKTMEFTGPDVVAAEAEFQAMINQELRERVDHERELNETKAERLALLGDLSQIDPEHMTLEEKHELWDFEREQMEERRAYEQERLEYLEVELTFAQEFGDAWEKAIGKVVIAERLAMVTMSALHGVTEQFMAAIIYGAPLSAKAMAKMISAMAFKESVYYAAQAIAKEGIAIYNFVSPYGDKTEGSAAQAAAVKFLAASVMFGTISAALGAAAGGGGGGGKSVSAGGGGGGGYSGAGGSGWQGSGQDSPTVIIQVEGSMQHIWETMVEKVAVTVSNQKRTGSFQKYPG